MADHLSVTFAALADPTRRAILARLSHGGASVHELAKPFALSLPGVSKHLKVLQRAGLITQSRNAQWRPCRLEGGGPQKGAGRGGGGRGVSGGRVGRPCRLEGGRLKEASEWVGEYRRFWDESFERLDEVLQDLIKEEKKKNDGKGRKDGAQAW